MTRLLNDRSPLDAALADANAVILLLSGAAADAVHNTAVAGAVEPWRKTFLVENLALLSLDESTRWFSGAPGRYAVLGRPAKDVRDHGPVDDLLSNGKPSIVEIQFVFSSGE